jgi:hypothetical protein
MAYFDGRPDASEPDQSRNKETIHQILMPLTMNNMMASPSPFS